MRRIGMQAGKMKICDCGRTALVGSQISFSIGVEFSESGAKQNYRPRWYFSVSSFPILEIAFGDQVVAVFRALPGDIHYDPWSHELVERDFIDSVLPFGEMDGGIDMSPPMFS